MTAAPSSPRGNRRARSADAITIRNAALACLLAALVAFLAFSPTIGHDFLRYDDEVYVSNNPHVRPFSFDTVIWLFTHPFYQAYTPLPLLSHALDLAVWGDDPRGHHLTNVILHALNTGLFLVLAFLILSRAVRKGGGEPDLNAGLFGAVTAALLFSLHPLRVESVAWISDRKDLVMAFFLFAALLSYLLFALKADVSPDRRLFRVSLIFFLFAVLSKATAVAGPAAMLGIDLAMKRTGGVRHLLREKLPFLIVAGAGGIVAVLAAQGAQRQEMVGQLGLMQQLLLPFYSIGFIVWKFFWPGLLTPVYNSPATSTMVLLAVLVLFLTAFAVVSFVWRKSGWLLAGWGTYVALLVPTLAGVYSGIQPWADRYSYVPLAALLLPVGGGAGLLWSRMAARGRGAAVMLGVAAIAGTCLVLTLRQLPRWKDSVTLWSFAALNVPDAGERVLLPLGVAYFHAGQPDSALALYRRVIELDPGSAQAYFSMGEAYAGKGELASAAEAYQEALRRDSLLFGASNNLADVMMRSGKMDEALAIYRKLARREPDDALIHNNLGFALMRIGDAAAAEASFRRAIRLAPGMKSPQLNLAVLYQNTGRPDLALDVLEHVQRLDPDDPGINYNRALALESLKRTAEAEAAYRRALIARPRYVDAWINLGNLIGREGRLQEARAMYRQVIASIPESAELCLNLAGIYNALGEKDSALATLQEAVRRKPGFAQAYYAMGLVYRKAGDSTAARQSFRIAARYGSREAADLLGPEDAKPRRR